MSQRALRSLLLVLAAAFTAAPVQGQPPAPQPSMMALNDMMQQCREAMALVDQTAKTVNDAERSNDAERMREALQNTRKPLNEMRQHMSSCTSMMDMVQGMHGSNAQGGMAMMGGGQESMAPTSGVQGQQQESGGMGTSPGMMCCMPGAGLHGAAGAAVIAVGALLALSLTAALIALTMFLWTRSRTAHA